MEINYSRCNVLLNITLFIILLTFNVSPSLGQGQQIEDKEKQGILKKIDDLVNANNETKSINDSIITKKEKAVHRQDSLYQVLHKKDSILKKYITEDSIFSNTGAGDLAILEDTSTFRNRNQGIKSKSNQTRNVSVEGENTWDKINKITHNKTYKKKHILDSSYTVFGWHPYWMGSSYKSYNFSLLSMIAYFSYEVNPRTGNYKTIHDWETTKLVDSAHVHGTKVLLSATLFGKKDNHRFLINVKAQKRFISQMSSLLLLKGADGVNIDFEGIGIEDSKRFSNFIIDLSTSLKKINKNNILTIALPAVDFENIYDVKSTENYVDLFVIMGYEYHGSTSKVAGPVSPLSSGNIWWPFNIETSVNEFLSKGINPKKLLLALPYYGSEWITNDLQFPSKVKKFVKNRTYRELKQKYNYLSCCVEEVSKSRFHSFRTNTNEYHQIWYEDSTALAYKYAWIKEKKIGGLGIWALGFDNGYTELWELLANKFSVKEKQNSKSKSTYFARMKSRLFYTSMSLLRNPKMFLTNPRPLFFLISGMFGFSLIGIGLLFRYAHRFGKFTNVAMKGVTVSVIIIGIILVMLSVKYLDVTKTLYLVGGILLGMLLLLIISYKMLKERDLP